MRQTFTRLTEAGLPPQQMSFFQQELFRHPELAIARQLKRLFDPDRILARGRYDL